MKNQPKWNVETYNKGEAQYKAALKIKSRLQDKADLYQEEKERLAWAEQRIEEGRLHFASKPAMASTAEFTNKVEEMFANKRQRSHKSAAKGIPVSKRKRGKRRQALRHRK